MADKRAIDKLKEAFCIDNRSRYIIKKEDVVILEIYWKPLTIADREAIYKTLAGMNKANDTESLEYACLLYTSPSPRDVEESRMPSSA